MSAASYGSPLARSATARPPTTRWPETSGSSSSAPSRSKPASHSARMFAYWGSTASWSRAMPRRVARISWMISSSASGRLGRRHAAGPADGLDAADAVGQQGRHAAARVAETRRRRREHVEHAGDAGRRAQVVAQLVQQGGKARALRIEPAIEARLEARPEIEERKQEAGDRVRPNARDRFGGPERALQPDARLPRAGGPLGGRDEAEYRRPRYETARATRRGRAARTESGCRSRACRTPRAGTEQPRSASCRAHCRRAGCGRAVRPADRGCAWPARGSGR